MRKDDSFLRHSSPFSAFSTTNHAHKPNTTLSSISNFTTAGPSAIADYSSRIDSSERGRAKESEIDTSFTSFRGTHGNLDDITSSIADRAKTRQRPKTSSTSAVLDVIELTSEDDDELALKPPKAKLKPKPKPKPKLTIKLMPKAKDQSANEANTSIQPNPPQPDEAAPKPPRPRPRPRPRKPPVPEPETARPIEPPPTSTPPTELPIATSSPRPLPMVSQLPPSDPPLPSMGTAYNDDPNTRAPPIEALFEGPLSSPNSLFSDGGKRMKKKKTNPSESDREIDIDELAPSSNPSRRPFAGQAMYDSSPHGMPPPPTFFAGSSSSSIGRDRNHEVPGAFTPPPQDGPDIVDLTMLPPTLIPPPKPKPKKPKKKTVDMSIYDDNNFGAGGMIVLDEDNQDDDFDPREEGSSKKKKAKAKPKEKSTKSKSKAKVASDEPSAPAKGKVVEVLLDPRPPSRGKGKAKADDKGKKKDTSDKEAFKSREFIEDSDDELDCVRVFPSGGYSVGSANTPGAVTSSKVQANPGDATQAPVSKVATASSAKAKAKRRRSVDYEALSQRCEEEEEHRRL
ncbi:hypothetical protein BDN70DRAFT_440528 [Pholiota conissans]|uniref:Uncharacterized protein n=1 Tax=Pholiota conissans TaxID=109636 RepID=A0A9P5YP19_9AGAR|nr:hypothetical protein BDN70DRAFT_440528 [Pholiota conissans]